MRVRSAALGSVLAALLAHTASCGDSDCLRNSDCPADMVCGSGSCQIATTPSDASVDVDVDADSDAATDATVDSPTDAHLDATEDGACVPECDGSSCDGGMTCSDAGDASDAGDSGDAGDGDAGEPGDASDGSSPDATDGALSDGNSGDSASPVDASGTD